MTKLFLWFGLGVLAFGAVAALELKHFAITDTSNGPSAPMQHLIVDNIPLSVRVADTPAEQAQGLSGTDPLPQDQGMLFVFSTDGSYAFWMKDMNYSLDIIWLDAAGRIVHIAPNLSPSTYPQSFSSPKPARYVLEVDAGFAAAHNVTMGDIVHFQ